MSEPSVTAYRRGGDLTMESPGGDAEAVRLELAEGVRISRSAGGEILLYRGSTPYGRRLADGVRDGWCTLVSGEG